MCYNTADVYAPFPHQFICDIVYIMSKQYIRCNFFKSADLLARFINQMRLNHFEFGVRYPGARRCGHMQRNLFVHRMQAGEWSQFVLPAVDSSSKHIKYICVVGKDKNNENRLAKQ